VPGWFFLISGLACGALALWLLTWERRASRKAIAAGIHLSGAVLTVKPSELVGSYPANAVRSPRLVVRFTWQGTSREEEIALRTSRPGDAYHPGQTVALAIDQARPDRVVLVDGGGRSASIAGCGAMYAGTVIAVLAIGLLARFLIGVF
jgi:hypothetical protein